MRKDGYLRRMLFGRVVRCARQVRHHVVPDGSHDAPHDRVDQGGATVKKKSSVKRKGRLKHAIPLLHTPRNHPIDKHD